MGESAQRWSDLLETPPSYNESLGSPQLIMCLDPYQQPAQDYAIAEPQIREDVFVMQRKERVVPISSQQVQSSSGYNPVIQFPNQYKGQSEFEDRTLIATNVHPETTREEIMAVFDPYNSIKNIDMSLIADGFCSVEYYDLRHANNVKRIANTATLHGNVIVVSYAPLSRIGDCKKPPNNGTIVVFHLPATGVTDKQIEMTFGQFGEIRQIRGTPSKPTQRFIEYWDTRAAEEALNSLNGKYVMGSKISIEFSLPGGFRKNAFMH